MDDCLQVDQEVPSPKMNDDHRASKPSISSSSIDRSSGYDDLHRYRSTCSIDYLNRSPTTRLDPYSSSPIPPTGFERAPTPGLTTISSSSPILSSHPIQPDHHHHQPNLSKTITDAITTTTTNTTTTTTTTPTPSPSPSPPPPLPSTLTTITTSKESKSTHHKHLPKDDDHSNSTYAHSQSIPPRPPIDSNHSPLSSPPPPPPQTSSIDQRQPKRLKIKKNQKTCSPSTQSIHQVPSLDPDPDLDPTLDPIDPSPSNLPASSLPKPSSTDPNPLSNLSFKRKKATSSKTRDRPSNQEVKSTKKSSRPSPIDEPKRKRSKTLDKGHHTQLETQDDHPIPPTTSPPPSNQSQAHHQQHAPHHQATSHPKQPPSQPNRLVESDQPNSTTTNTTPATNPPGTTNHLKKSSSNTNHKPTSSSTKKPLKPGFKKPTKPAHHLTSISSSTTPVPPPTIKQNKTGEYDLNDPTLWGALFGGGDKKPAAKSVKPGNLPPQAALSYHGSMTDRLEARKKHRAEEKKTLQAHSKLGFDLLRQSLDMMDFEIEYKNHVRAMVEKPLEVDYEILPRLSTDGSRQAEPDHQSSYRSMENSIDPTYGPPPGFVTIAGPMNSIPPTTTTTTTTTATGVYPTTNSSSKNSTQNSTMNVFCRPDGYKQYYNPPSSTGSTTTNKNPNSIALPPPPHQPHHPPPQVPPPSSGLSHQPPGPIYSSSSGPLHRRKTLPRPGMFGSTFFIWQTAHVP